MGDWGGMPDWDQPRSLCPVGTLKVALAGQMLVALKDEA